MFTVHQIREQIKVCRACDLFQVGRGPIPFSGPAPNFLAVVGEAPGFQEDIEGQPFVGPAGTLLRECLRDASLNPDRITYVNTVSCYPKRTPNAAEINACSTNLLAQLEFTNPTWVVLLGNVALKAWRPDLGITRARGKVLYPPGRRWKMFVTFHPAFALRQYKGEQILRSDLVLLTEMMDAEEADRVDQLADDSCVRCGATPDELGEHDECLRFDAWNVPYCGQCWPQAPQNQAAAKEEKKVTRAQEKTGQLFPEGVLYRPAPSLIDPVAAAAAKQAGIDAADAYADEVWKQAAYLAIARLCVLLDEFTADEVWEELQGTTATTRQPSALGPVFMQARDDGLIVNTGRLRPTKLSRRHRDITVWRSVQRTGP
jgi:uracil-DNA glycosylase